MFFGSGTCFQVVLHAFIVLHMSAGFLHVYRVLHMFSGYFACF